MSENKKKLKNHSLEFLPVKQALLSQQRAHNSDFSVVHSWFSHHFSPGTRCYFFLEFHDSSLISLKLKFRPNRKKGHCHFAFLLHRYSKSLNFGLVSEHSQLPILCNVENIKTFNPSEQKATIFVQNPLFCDLLRWGQQQKFQ